MAKYTYSLQELESTFGREKVKEWFKDYQLSDFLTADEIAVITERGTWNKDQLAERIITHFYLREIGTDAIGEFILMAKDLMHEIMETYAPLIYSASIKYDPLVNVDFTETFDRRTDDTRVTNSTSHSDSDGLVISSDTPQGNINKNDILEGKYATSTNANENEATANDSSNSAGNGNEHYERKTKGNSGVSATAQKMVEQYRDNIRALNTEIVYACESLFIGLY